MGNTLQHADGYAGAAELALCAQPRLPPARKRQGPNPAHRASGGGLSEHDKQLHDALLDLFQVLLDRAVDFDTAYSLVMRAAKDCLPAFAEQYLRSSMESYRHKPRSADASVLLRYGLMFAGQYLDPTIDASADAVLALDKPVDSWPDVAAAVEDPVEKGICTDIDLALARVATLGLVAFALQGNSRKLRENLQVWKALRASSPSPQDWNLVLRTYVGAESPIHYPHSDQYYEDIHSQLRLNYTPAIARRVHNAKLTVYPDLSFWKEWPESTDPYAAASDSKAHD